MSSLERRPTEADVASTTSLAEWAWRQQRSRDKRPRECRACGELNAERCVCARRRFVVAFFERYPLLDDDEASRLVGSIVEDVLAEEDVVVDDVELYDRLVDHGLAYVRGQYHQRQWAAYDDERRRQRETPTNRS